MKKWLIGVMAVVTAVSLVACTPTTEKNKSETTTATTAIPDDMIPQTTGGVSDKVPDPNVKPVAVISIYHGGSGSLTQDMDSLDSEELDAQLLVDKLTEFGVLTEGTEVLSFDVQGGEEDAVGTLNLNKADSAEGCSDQMFLTEIGNTFTENFELVKLKLKVNGANFQGKDVQHGDDDYLTYNTDYESVQ